MAGFGAIAGLMGIGAASSALSSAISYGLQKDQQKFNAIEAQKTRDWQRMMSDTQYQRQVADMEAAGLNPAAIGASSGGTSYGATEASSGIVSNPSSGMLGALAYNALRMLSNNKEDRNDLVNSLVSSVRSDALGVLNSIKK